MLETILVEHLKLTGLYRNGFGASDAIWCLIWWNEKLSFLRIYVYFYVTWSRAGGNFKNSYPFNVRFWNSRRPWPCHVKRDWSTNTPIVSGFFSISVSQRQGRDVQLHRKICPILSLFALFVLSKKIGVWLSLFNFLESKRRWQHGGKQRMRNCCEFANSTPCLV